MGPISEGILTTSTLSNHGLITNPFISINAKSPTDDVVMPKKIKKSKVPKKNNKNNAVPNEIDKDGNLIKARRMAAMNENEEIRENVLDIDQMEKICDLCQRPRPIFVVDTDDMIKRLPERFLSPLLKSLKKDFNNKRQYLKFLRINAKYIKACNCEDKSLHAYCVTA